MVNPDFMVFALVQDLVYGINELLGTTVVAVVVAVV